MGKDGSTRLIGDIMESVQAVTGCVAAAMTSRGAGFGNAELSRLVAVELSVGIVCGCV